MALCPTAFFQTILEGLGIGSGRTHTHVLCQTHSFVLARSGLPLTLTFLSNTFRTRSSEEYKSLIHALDPGTVNDWYQYSVQSVIGQHSACL